MRAPWFLRLIDRLVALYDRQHTDDMGAYSAPSKTNQSLGLIRNPTKFVTVHPPHDAARDDRGARAGLALTALPTTNPGQTGHSGVSSLNLAGALAPAFFQTESLALTSARSILQSLARVDFNG